METYTVGEKKFKAWSKMRCDHGRKDPENHEPHVWNSEFMIYGPYFCPGWPLFEPKHRADVEPQ